MWGFHDGMGWWMMFGSIWMVLFWVAIIGLVIWGVGRISASQEDSRNDSETPIV